MRGRMGSSPICVSGSPGGPYPAKEITVGWYVIQQINAIVSHSQFCNTLNRSLPPGTARTMDRISPTSCCHLLVFTGCWWGGTESLCARSSMVRHMVIKIQPNIIFHVTNVASPLRIFLTETGFWQCLLSCRSKGRKILSRVCSRTHLTWRR
jgi:hypothetical protein